ncbi:MAG: CHAT domain-containing tetratricopeptide repeat protein [Planctomycetaceae bacterium]
MTDTTETKILLACSLLVFAVIFGGTAQADEGPMLQVTANNVPIQVTDDGVSRTIATISKGTRLWAFETKGDFYRVMDPATQEKGWIWNRHVSEAEFDPEALEIQSAAWGDLDKAKQYEDEGDNDKARALFEQLFKATLKAYGNDHPDTALARQVLGKYYQRMGENPAAAEMLQQCLATYRKVLGSDHPNSTNTMYTLALLYRAMGEYATAESLLQECRELESKILGEEHPDAILTVDLLAWIYYDMAANDKAEQLFQECLRIRTKTLGPLHPDTLASMSGLVYVYRAQGENAKAASLLSQSLDTRRKELGEEHPDIVLAKNELAVCYLDMSAYDKAESLFRECLRIRTSALGEEHADTIVSIYNLAVLHRSKGDTREAEKLLQKCIDLRVKVQGEEHPDTILARNELALVYHDMSEYDKAEPLYKECLRIRVKVLGEEHPDTALSMSNLADMYRDIGDYENAERLYQQSLAIRRKVLGEEHIETAESICRIGDIAYSCGEYSRAEQFLIQGVELYRRLLGEEHSITAEQLNSLASLYHTLGDFNQAEALYQKSLNVRRHIYGNEHALVATSLNNIGVLYFNKHDYAKAEPLLKQSLEIRQKVLGGDHAEVGNSLHNLGATCMYTGRYAEARPLMERALEIYRHAYQDDHTNTAASLSRLALLNQRTANYAEAEQLYVQSTQMFRKLLGDDHPDTIKTLNRMADLQLEMKSFGKAVETQDAEMQGARRHLCNVLPALTEIQRQKYLASSYADDFATALSLALECQSDRRAANLSAGWVLNGKAAGAEALAEAALLSSEEAAPLVIELRSVRDQIAKIAVRDSSKVDADTRERLAGLESRQQQLSQKIATFSLGLKRGDPWVTTGALMSEIPFNSVFVNIAKIRRRDFQSHDEDTMWLPTRYVAWVVPSAGSGAVKIVDLGASATIDAKVREVREQIQKDFERLRNRDADEIQTTEELRNTTQELSKLLLSPLEESLTDVEELILSPDGELWTLPWDALVTQEGSFLIEKYRTRYVISGREFVRDMPERALIGAPAIFADANFNLDQDDVLAADSGGLSELRSVSNAYFPQLKSSAAEAISIKPSIDGFTSDSAKLFLADDCQEATFKGLHRPRVLVVSTHGYVEKPGESKESQSATISYDNPLLRCGLAFAGANNRQLAAEDGKEDGILTGLEIVGIDLRGTELVVLSACQTGLGDIQDGEGVAGLRHAFQLAGARAVISSLWEVEDGATARLINAFFENLAKGLSKSEALRQAQLFQIKSRRERFGAAHPFFWSAFTLTGD